MDSYSHEVNTHAIKYSAFLKIDKPETLSYISLQYYY